MPESKESGVGLGNSKQKTDLRKGILDSQAREGAWAPRQQARKEFRFDSPQAWGAMGGV